MNHPCLCGCGTLIRPGAKFVRGHHWKVQRIAAGVPDAKVCEHCGETYTRADTAARQSNIHWMERRFCSEECRQAAVRIDRSIARACPNCKILREPHDFYNGRSWCRHCERKAKKPLDPAENRRRNLWNAYKITPEQYDEMLAAQGGVCACCGNPARNYRTSGVLALAVDHCHETGKVRGLLCGHCNKGVGCFGHDLDRLAQAVAYLKRTM